VTILEVENMGPDELKEQHDACVAAAKASPLDELARRYVKSRYDATRRDVLLGEQAKTLKALQTGLDASQESTNGWKAKAEEANQLLTAASTVVKDLTATLTAEREQADEKLAHLRRELAEQILRADAAEARAKDRRVALAEVAAVINPRLASEG
jgi:hypothetical protein